MGSENGIVTGVADGVPYVALPPVGAVDGGQASPLVIAWHLNDLVGDVPICVVGASIGALPAQLVMANRSVQVSAATLVSPVIQLAEVVAANERRFRVRYPWSDASRAVAARFDLVARAADIAALDPQPAILLITGGDDDPAFPRQTHRLRAELQRRYRDPQRVAVMSLPGMGHAFAAEPGIEPAPQTGDAQRVDAAVTDWFVDHLGSPAARRVERLLC
jgi:Prolyl oligopeptidase family